MKILYVAECVAGTTARQRMETLSGLGHRVTSIDTRAPSVAAKRGRWTDRALRKVGIWPDYGGINRQILEHVRRETWDVLWLDKSFEATGATLEAVREIQPQCVILGLSLDNILLRHNTVRTLSRALPHYDIYVTTKSYMVEPLKARGVPQVYFLPNFYSPKVHRPLNISEEQRAQYGAPVGFIGSWERERADSIHYLADRGIDVRVWGNHWENEKRKHPRVMIEHRAVEGEQYALALNAFDINLCFLRKMNFDTQTTRSIEIPACGGFMLAKRTEEHLHLFSEGKEAEFFEGDEELYQKVRYYLDHPDQRKKVAAAGRERCLKGKYSFEERIAGILDAVARRSETKLTSSAGR